MFSLTSTIAAGTPEPLSLDEAKANLHIAHDADNARIRSLIVVAREYVEVWTGRALVPQTVVFKLDAFPGWKDDYVIRLPRSPATALTSIAYYDSTDVSQTHSSSLYQSDLSSEPARVMPTATEVTWPATYERMAAVTVTYTAGYATPAVVPERLKQAMHLLINHWYVNREPVGNVGGEIAFSLKALLGSSWTGSMVGTFAHV
jgi:uncharacterized phiE125 gp8 family phage protein